eukprot:gene22649-29798_t
MAKPQRSHDQTHTRSNRGEGPPDGHNAGAAIRGIGKTEEDPSPEPGQTENFLHAARARQGSEARDPTQQRRPTEGRQKATTPTETNRTTERLRNRNSPEREPADGNGANTMNTPRPQEYITGSAANMLEVPQTREGPQSNCPVSLANNPRIHGSYLQKTATADESGKTGSTQRNSAKFP